MRFRCRPPANFRIETDLTYEQRKTVENNINKNKEKLKKLFGLRGQAKFWNLLRTL